MLWSSQTLLYTRATDSTLMPWPSPTLPHGRVMEFDVWKKEDDTYLQIRDQYHQCRSRQLTALLKLENDMYETERPSTSDLRI
jgi:hypothetical protein